MSHPLSLVAQLQSLRSSHNFNALLYNTSFFVYCYAQSSQLQKSNKYNKLNKIFFLKTITFYLQSGSITDLIIDTERR